MIANYAREVENSLFFTLDQLRQIITSLSGLPGKKGVIYVSNGLPMIPGMDLYYEMSRVTHESTVLSEMYQFDRSRLYAQLAATANAQGVTLYTINAAGPRRSAAWAPPSSPRHRIRFRRPWASATSMTA